jgi:hypothetical protein
MLGALAVLPLLDALVAFVAFPVLWCCGGRAGLQLMDPAEAARTFAVLSGVLGVLVTLCGALPVVWWLMKRGPLTLEQLLIAGLALGNAPFAAYLCFLAPFAIMHVMAGTMSEHLLPASELLATAVRSIGIGSFMGSLSAVVFWFLGIRNSDVSR